MSSRRGRLWAMLGIWWLAACALCAGVPTRADYERIALHRMGAPVPVPADGLAWRLDVAQWELAAGTLRLQEPVAGVATGAWFEGSGSLRLEVPDPYELRQLRRLLRDPEIDALETTFDRMLVRSSGGAPMDRLPPPAGGGDEPPEVAERHDHYFRILRLDVDSRVLAAMADPSALYWQADIHTPDHDWMTITYDSHRREELTVEVFSRRYALVESWLSLDRAADRGPDGRPSGPPDPLFDVRHVDIVGDLSERARKYGGASAGTFTVRVDLTVLEDGVSALPFRLRSLAEVTAVRNGEGGEVDYVRDHIGGRSSGIDKDVYDTSLLVLLPEAVERGSEMSVTFDYELRMPKYAGGRSWYPGRRDSGGLHDRHTARFELTVDDRYELQAMGRQVDRRNDDGLTTIVWELDEPAKMVTFTMQKANYTKELDFDGLPHVTTVGDLSGGLRVLNEQRIDDVAADTVNSINFLQQLLDEPLPEDHFYAALIPSSHGQAFPGFLHLGEFTAALDNANAVEAFRAHEVGHQWWGHIVGWDSYRDQWLSEGFAEYLSLMFVEATVDKGPKLFQEAITAYSREVRGSLESAFSSFARPGYSLLTALGAERMGPIGHGWRARVGEAPTAYLTLAYYKGALVLHMLRVTTRQMTHSDDAFLAILRDFVDTHRGGYPSTDDFRAAVERQVPADWSWFFDQWVYGAEIPTYLWEWETAAASEGAILRLTVEQRDVGPEFRMLVPVRIDMGRGRVGEVAVFVDEPLETFEIPLPSRPRKVEFNAGDAVIANVKRR